MGPDCLMLWVLVSRFGRRVAAAAALGYLASILMPAVALALSDGAVSAYCFEEITEQVAALQPHTQPAQANVQAHVHVHADGTVHYHAGHADHHQLAAQKGSEPGKPQAPPEHSHDVNCCGAYGFTAVLPGLSVPVQEPRALLGQSPIISDWRAGRGPARIDRPPILV
jgi:hypothetical protein